MYAFYKKQNFQYIQFIPCLPDLNKERNSYSLVPEKYYQFYETISIVDRRHKTREIH